MCVCVCFNIRDSNGINIRWEDYIHDGKKVKEIRNPVTSCELIWNVTFLITLKTIWLTFAFKHKIVTLIIAQNAWKLSTKKKCWQHWHITTSDFVFKSIYILTMKLGREKMANANNLSEIYAWVNILWGIHHPMGANSAGEIVRLLDRKFGL